MKKNRQINDLMPFEHGQEGTHYACAEMANRDGDTECCGCTNHKCEQPESGQSKIEGQKCCGHCTMNSRFDCPECQLHVSLPQDKEEGKRKSTDEFVKYFKLIKEHFEAEEITLTDYEIGHFASMFQQETEQVREEARRETAREIIVSMLETEMSQDDRPNIAQQEFAQTVIRNIKAKYSLEEIKP